MIGRLLADTTSLVSKVFMEVFGRYRMSTAAPIRGGRRKTWEAAIWLWDMVQYPLQQPGFKKLSDMTVEEVTSYHLAMLHALTLAMPEPRLRKMFREETFIGLGLPSDTKKQLTKKQSESEEQKSTAKKTTKRKATKKKATKRKTTNKKV